MTTPAIAEGRRRRTLRAVLGVVVFTGCLPGCSVYTSDLLPSDHLVVGVDADVGALTPDADPAGAVADGSTGPPVGESDGASSETADAFGLPPPDARSSSVDAEQLDVAAQRDAMVDVKRVSDASADTAPPLCSSRAGTSVKLTIHNANSARTIVALWIDASCVERFQSNLAPMASFLSSTFTGHVWRIRDKVSEDVLMDIPPLTRDTTVSIP